MAIFKQIISPSSVKAISSENVEEQNVVFQELLTGNGDKSIANNLLTIFKDDLVADGGGGMIETIDLKVIAVDLISQHTGKVLLTYNVNRFFACDGIEHKVIKKERLDFAIDVEKMLMTITLFELPKH